MAGKHGAPSSQQAPGRAPSTSRLLGEANRHPSSRALEPASPGSGIWLINHSTLLRAPNRKRCTPEALSTCPPLRYPSRPGQGEHPLAHTVQGSCSTAESHDFPCFYLTPASRQLWPRTALAAAIWYTCFPSLLASQGLLPLCLLGVPFRRPEVAVRLPAPLASPGKTIAISSQFPHGASSPSLST